MVVVRLVGTLEFIDELKYIECVDELEEIISACVDRMKELYNTKGNKEEIDILKEVHREYINGNRCRSPSFESWITNRIKRLK